MNRRHVIVVLPLLLSGACSAAGGGSDGRAATPTSATPVYGTATSETLGTLLAPETSAAGVPVDGPPGLRHPTAACVALVADPVRRMLADLPTVDDRDPTTLRGEVRQEVDAGTAGMRA